MPVPVAVLDANVLYSADLRNLLMHLAVGGLYQPRWSAQIQSEWISNLLANRPDLSEERLQRTKSLMNQHVLDAMVIGYEDLVDRLLLPDPADRHVLAVAIRGGARIIVTYNLRDFPKTALAPHRVEAVHPDEFLLRLMMRDFTGFLAAVRRHRASLRNPAQSPGEYIRSLEKHRLPRISHSLRDLL